MLDHVIPDLRLNRTLFHISMMTSTKTLCYLAQIGDLDAIKGCKINKSQVNELITGAIYGFAPTYLGVYNALMIAAAYRHYDVIKYFVEEKQADLTVKGGSGRDFTALQCAEHVWWWGKEPNLEMISYLQSKSRNFSPTKVSGSSRQAFFTPERDNPANSTMTFRSFVP